MATRDELERALIGAHNAGDAEAATALANALKAMPAVPAQPMPQDMPGVGESMMIAAGHGMTRIGQGMQQGYYAMTGDKPKQDALAANVAEEESIYQPVKDAHPFATAAGEAFPTMAVPATGIPGMMVASALPGLLEYGSPEERLIKGGISAAGGGIGGLLGKAAAKLAKPFQTYADPVRESALAVFEKAGIPVSAAQKTGNRSLKWIDSALDNLPWVADKQYAAKSAQQAAYNKAVAKTFGTEAEELTPEVLSAAKTAIGDKFNDLSARNRLQFTNQELNDVARIQFDAQRYGTSDHQRIVGNFIDDYLAKVEPDGTISGLAYRKMDSAIGKKMRATHDGDLRSLLGDLRDTMRGAMDNSITKADQEAWKKARSEYANLQTVADVAKNNASGDVSPAGLLSKVNTNSKSAKFTGGGELGELARAGKGLLQPLPDSGTAQRAYWMRMLGGGGIMGLGGLLSPAAAVAAAAGAGAPLAAQSAMWGGKGAKYLTDGLLNLSDKEIKALLKTGQYSGQSLLGALSDR